MANLKMKPKEGESFGDLLPQCAKDWNYELTKIPDNWNTELLGPFGPFNVKPCSKYEAIFDCKYHGPYPMRIQCKSKGQGCKKCNESNGNKLLESILSKHDIKHKQEFTITELGNKRFDNSILNTFNEIKCLLEYDGEQHFKVIDFGGKGNKLSKECFENTKKSDNIKNSYFLKERKPLLRIPYTFDPIKDAQKIEEIILEFIKTKKVPQEILDFYAKHKFSNYVECVKELESKMELVA